MIWEARYRAPGDSDLDATHRRVARALASVEPTAALQPYVDSAISKTVNVPADIGLAEFEGLYRQAYELGLKGCTVFRPNPVTGSVLSSTAACAAGATTCDGDQPVPS